MRKTILLCMLIMFAFSVSAQDYKQLIAEGNHTVAHISDVAELHFDLVGRGRGTGYKPFKRWQYFAQRAMDETGKLKSPEFYYNELENYNAALNNEGFTPKTTVGTWEEMGPTYWNATAGWNPGVGRITSIAIEESNLNHIIAGANTGGVWKSLDGGSTWTVLTDNLANIDVYALAIDPLVNSTYYWGSSGGAIFKSTDSGATWNLHSTISGTVNKILIHPTDSSKMYASAQSGGLYKSIDGGATWTIIDSNATTGYDFEFKPSDPNTVYATGNEFYKSTDGGVTFSSPDGLSAWTKEFVSGSTNWSTSGANQNSSATPRTGNTLALFYINNYSNPKTKLVSPSLNLSGATSPEVKFSYTNVSWGSDIDELRVFYKTSANGAWTQLAEYTAESSVWADITIALPNPSADYYVAFEATSNYGRGLTLDDISVEATNLGVVFSDGFESAPNQFLSGPKMIGVSANDPSVVYVIEALDGAFGGFHKSTDNGSVFTKLDHTGKNYFGYSTTGDDTLGQAPRDMDIAVNPNDVNDVHIAGINTWRSTDGGAVFNISSQWTPGNASNLNIGYCHADVDLMQFVGTGSSTKLYIGSDGGIFRAENPTTVNSSYYTDLTSGMGIRQFYRIGVSQTNPVVVTGGSQDNGTSVLGFDGNWTDWLGADGMEGFVDKTNSQIMYGTSQNGSLYKTINSGASRFGLSSPDGKSGNWVTPFEQDPATPNVIYTGYDEVYKSIDGGGNWVSISQNFGNNVDELKIAPSNNQVMYMANGSDLWKTENGGVSNWTQLSGFSGSINSIAIHPTDPSKVVIATTGNEKVYLSSDSGATWSSIKWDLPNFSSQAVAWQNNGNDGLYVGMNYGIYYTDTVLGNTWVPFNNGLPNVRINELEINTAENKIYAATYGRGLWKSNVYDSSALSVNDFQLNDFQLYPNPANSVVNLKWNASEDVSVRIYNTLGKLMFYGKKLNLLNGLSINVSSYNAGIYFVKLNNENGEITKKLILK